MLNIFKTFVSQMQNSHIFSCSDVTVAFYFAVTNIVPAMTLRTINFARTEIFRKDIFKMKMRRKSYSPKIFLKEILYEKLPKNLVFFRGNFSLIASRYQFFLGTKATSFTTLEGVISLLHSWSHVINLSHCVLLFKIRQQLKMVIDY